VARTEGPDYPASFVPAYHWACAIDDFDGGFDLLVRSVDLAPAAVAQRLIQDWLGKLEGRQCQPAIFHTSLIVQDDGTRLEKRTKGVTLPELGERMTPVRLTGIFQSSFDKQLLTSRIAVGTISGEPQARVTLAQLGL